MSAVIKSGGVKLKPSSGNKVLPTSSSMGKTKIDSSAAVTKKVGLSSIKQPADSKQKSASNSVSTSEVKTKATTGSSKTMVTKTVTTKTVTKTREKKVFSLPGQKFDIPEEREPLRIFYESLSQQIPSSEMAEFCLHTILRLIDHGIGVEVQHKGYQDLLMEHGLLSPDRAKKALEKKQRKQKQIRMGTPIKSLPPPMASRAESSKKQQQVSKNGDVKAKKRVLDDSDDDNDFKINKRSKW